MQFYQELTLIEQEDISLYFIWSKLYTQLHLAFVEQKDSQEKIAYGVSFPRYRLNSDKGIGFLGDKLRIFAHSVQQLEQLNLNKWLERITDYVHIATPRETPLAKITGYAIYSRAVPKKSVEQRIQHQAQLRNISFEEAATGFKDFVCKSLAEKHNISLEEAATEHFKNHVNPLLSEPFISLKSLSGKHLFKLHIKKTLVDEASKGTFGTYALSKTASVPEF